MSATKLEQTGGYTPLVDEILQAHGMITAAVFGRVWRFCQMEKGICDASQSKLAGLLGISRKAVNESLKLLVDEGYLRDVTPPEKAGITRIYEDTGRANIKPLEKQPETCNPGLQPPVTVGDTPCNPGLQPPVTVGYTKKESLREESKELNQQTEEAGEQASHEPHHPITAIEAERIYTRVTGHISMPSGSRDEMIRLICDIHDHKNSHTAEYLKPFYLAISAAKTKNSRPYSTLSPLWLDFASSGVIPDYVLTQLDAGTLGQMGPEWVEKAKQAKGQRASQQPSDAELLRQFEEAS